MKMEFKKINEDTVLVDLTPNDLLRRGFHLKDLRNEEFQDKFINTVLTELQTQNQFEIFDSFVVNLGVSPSGVKIAIREVNVEELSQESSPFEDPQFLTDFIKQSMKENHPFFQKNEDCDNVNVHDVVIPEYLFEFRDIDTVIQMVSSFNPQHTIGLESNLYAYDGKYYLLLRFLDEQDEDIIEDILSCVKEFSFSSSKTHYLLEEYGKTLMQKQAIEDVYRHFIDSKGMKVEPNSPLFTIFVPIDIQNNSPLDEQECIEVLVNEEMLADSNKVCFETLLNDEGIQFSVEVNLSKQAVTGKGSKKHRHFIFENVLPVYLGLCF